MAQGIEKDMAVRAASMRVPLRGLHFHLHADASSQPEETAHPDQRGLFRDSDSMPPVSSDIGREDEPRNDAGGSAEGVSEQKDITATDLAFALHVMYRNARDAGDTEKAEYYEHAERIVIERCVFEVKESRKQKGLPY
jgi:hypothetical protein